MWVIGYIAILSGLLLVGIGTAILFLGAAQLYRQMFQTLAATPVGGAAGTAAVNLADLAKLIEAIIKMPQWLLAVLAGDLQIWLGYWLSTGSRLF